MRLISWTLRTGSEQAVLGDIFVFFIRVSYAKMFKIQAVAVRHQAVTKLRLSKCREF